MPPVVLGISFGLFLVSAVLEGIITLAVFQALETINPRFIQQASAKQSRALGALALAAVVLVAGGVLVAAASPDGIAKLTGQGASMIQSPLAGYELKFWESPWMQKASAGLLGLLLISAVCLMLGRILRARATVTR